MSPPVGKGAIRVAFVCPSVCLSVRPSRTREPKGLACPNLEGRFPTFDATRIPISVSKGQRSRSPGPLMLAHIVRNIFRTARATNFKLGTWMEDATIHISHRRHNLQGQRSRSESHVISLSRLGPMLYLCH